jgi:hypothetical protein
MKLRYFILLLLISNISFAQNGKFSSEKEGLNVILKEVLFPKNSNIDSEVQDSLETSKEASFTMFYASISDEEAKNISSILNNLEIDLRSEKYLVEQLIETLECLDSVGVSISKRKDWLKTVDIDINNIQLRKQRRYYFTQNRDLVVNNTFKASNNSIWSWDGRLNTKFENGRIIYYNSNSDYLKADKYGASFSFYNVNFNFSPASDSLNILKSRIYWPESTYSKDSLFADVMTLKIKSDVENISIENSELTNLYFGPRKLKGVLKINLENQSLKEKLYPEFIGYETNLILKNILEDVDYKGGIKINNKRFAGVSSDNSTKSEMLFYKDGKLMAKLHSWGFLIDDKSVQSVNSEVTFYLGQDSIYHPQVTSSYDIETQQMNMVKNKKWTSKSPVSNTYSAMDFYPREMLWDKKNNKIRFLTESFDRIPILSARYFEREMAKKFKGFNYTNPIKKVQRFQFYPYRTHYKVSDLAKFMEIPEKYASSLVTEMAILGMLIYDEHNQTFRYTNKLTQAIAAYDRRIDYDVLKFISPKDKAILGEIDLETMQTELTGIERLYLEDKKDILVFPKGKVKVRDNFNYTFDGDVIIGNYEFRGKDYDFKYDEFKIDFNGKTQLKSYVPSFYPNDKGEYYFQPIQNKIDSVIGEFFIDSPNNKSGRFHSPVYPILKNNKDSYVYYNSRDIKDSVYTPDELYVKLFPFEIDSLYTSSIRNEFFKSEVFTNDIFPVFEYELYVQPDYYLGFLYITDENGFDLYKKGKYFDNINLDGNGLTGQGTVEYLTTSFFSRDIEFYPDSLRAHTDSYEIEKVKDNTLDFPSIKNDQVDVLWLPKKDSVFLSPIKSKFIMYDNLLDKEGSLFIANKRLYGGGEVTFSQAIMNSNNFNFLSDSFSSDSLGFKLRDNENAPFAYAFYNGRGVVDVANRNGNFTLNGSKPASYFLKNNYLSTFDIVEWDEQKRSIDLSGSKQNKKYSLTSINPYQDSLSFNAKHAYFDTYRDQILADDVSNLFVADSEILPDSAKVTILDDGYMKAFSNAKLKLGIGKFEHILTDANLTVKSKFKLDGNAEYFYKDEDDVVRPISMDDIFVDDKKKIVRARGIIEYEDNFMLSAYFRYYGKVEVTGESNLRNFAGYVSLVHYCDHIETGEIPIDDYIDPQEVRVRVTNFENLPKFEDVFTGIYYNQGDREFAAGFIMPDQNMFDNRLISAEGTISYDKKNYTYKIGGDKKKGVIQNTLYFYNDECRMEGRGDISFNSLQQDFDLTTIGDIVYDFNDKEIDIRASMFFDFFFNSRIMESISNDFQMSSSFSSDIIDKDISDYVRLRILGVKKEETGLNIFGDSQKEREEKYKFPLFMEDIKLKWDSERLVFYSDDKIYLRSINRQNINKFFKGKVEVARVGSNYDISVMLLNDEGNYYYFRFNKDVIEFHTDQKIVMEMFDQLANSEKKGAFKGAKITLKKASDVKVRTLRRRYDL